MHRAPWRLAVAPSARAAALWRRHRSRYALPGALYRNGHTRAAEEKDDRGRCHHVAAMIEDPRINGQDAEHENNGQPVDSEVHGREAEYEETVDGLPVLADVRTIERSSPASLPAVQAAAAAATGFVAG